MDALDFLVFFIWVIILYPLVALTGRRYQDPFMRKHRKRAFLVRAFASLCYGLFLLYISPGDSTTLYFPEGVNIWKLILKDPSNISLLFIPAKDFNQALLSSNANMGYFDQESNFMVTRLTAFFSFFTFGKFLAINLFFSLFAFTGAWRLFRFFYEQYPHLGKQFALATLYLPTFVFWSSGILKDPLCVGSIGWITYAAYRGFVLKKNPIKNLLIMIVFSWLIALVKSYILVSYLPFLLLYISLTRLSQIRNALLKASLVLVFIGVSISGFLIIINSLPDLLGDFASKGISESILSFQSRFAQKESVSDSNFSLGVEFDGSPGGLIKIAPRAVIATLYRPYLWESKKISTLLSSLESLAMMLFTLYVLLRVGIFRFIGSVFRYPIIMYCFLFAILFSVFVGVTTPNFGSLVRYKIPGMPFYLISIILILDNYKRQKKKVEGNITSPLTVSEP